MSITTTMTPSVQRGSATLLQLELFLPAMSTSDQSSTSSQATSLDIGNVISLPESAAGPMPFSWPDGPATDLFGQALAPANPSPPQDDKAALLTSGICGLDGFGSSASVALTQSLANRLRERLGSAGSIEFQQTWKRKDTPAGRRYWAHTASARRTSDSGSSGWPTPVSNDDNKSVEAHLAMKARMGGNRTAITSLQVIAQLSGWPTPTRQDQIGSGVRDYPATETHHSGTTLTDAARLAGWATPGEPDSHGKTAFGRQIVGWGTPRSTDAEKNVRTPEGAAKEIARKGAQNDLGLASGLLPSGSPASTARRGALNPRFSLWLMGYPTEWASCGEAVTLSARKPPRSS